jgi:hypothetical protein
MISSGRRRWAGQGVCPEKPLYCGAFLAEHRAAADCLQRPLLRRSRSRQQLSPSVDMTFDVKGWEPLFYIRSIVFPFVSRKSRSQENTTVAHAAIRRLALTFRASVGCLPLARDERTL